MDNAPDSVVTVLQPRVVPLGGPRAMTVRRTIPAKERSFIGAWCFIDHYGPDDVASSGGMDVPPHPHTELQTVSWLFEGEIEHRDSGGVHDLVLPGEMNLMTSGRGICHSEVSTPKTSILHGVQLWVVLPEADRHAPRAFDHYAPPAVTIPGGSYREFVGPSSPIRTYTPLLGMEIRLDPGAAWTYRADRSFEHGLLVDSGTVTLEGQPLRPDELGVVEAGRAELTLENTGSEPALLILLGGVPFEESIVMWWNFIGRSHEDVVAYREEWNARSDHFGAVTGYDDADTWLPAPELPHVQLRPRNRHGRA